VEKTATKTPWRTLNWSGFFASWGGWLFDGFDASLYAFVALEATRALLPATGIPLGLTSFYIALFFAAFLIGWGSSFVFGPLSDRYGRFRMLAISILTYAVGTLLSGLATNAYDFMFFRFISGLGIGAEWFIGGTGVSEIWPEDRRVMGAGLFHSGFYFGFFFAAAAGLFAYPIVGWRGMFWLGIIPAFYIFYIRRTTKEPKKWVNVKEKLGKELRAFHSFRITFSKEYRKATVVGCIVMCAVILGLWAGTVYAPTAVANVAQANGLATAAAVRLGALGGVVIAIMTIIGCIAMPVMAEKIGRRNTLVVFLVSMFISVLGLYQFLYYFNNLFYIFAMFILLGFGGADFSVFSLWLPELYPTEARTSGFGVVSTFGRYFAAAFNFFMGFLILAYGFGHGIAVTSVAFLVVIPLVYLIRETKGKGMTEKALEKQS
jgi:MFS family permease